MADMTTIITQEGKEKLEEELQYLKVDKRKEVAEKLKEARAQGDLSENAEYDAAKEEQGQMESRIEEIEAILKNATVADSNGKAGVVNVGNEVEIENVTSGQKMKFHIVGATEANSLEGKLSLESPVGKALLGHAEGETVTVSTPGGDMKFKITGIGSASAKKTIRK
ncbi:MAG: transcription elongation factor GreA [Eubacteriales bacterium]|jgi:transcription elongation factor GreA